MLVKGYKKPLTREDFVNEIIRADSFVIVEGKKDVAKLRKLGIINVIQLSRRSLCSFAEKVSEEHKRVILLMDNDKEGSKLFSKLKSEFGRLGVFVDESFQEKLASLKVSHVEGL